MEVETPNQEPTMLHSIRNMWQFANLAQYLSLFKGALKLDEDFGIEVRVCQRPRRFLPLVSIHTADGLTL